MLHKPRGDDPKPLPMWTWFVFMAVAAVLMWIGAIGGA